MPVDPGSINWTATLLDGALAALLATIAAAIVSVFIAKTQNRALHSLSIKDHITKIIEISIQYPYLEDDAYCASWPETGKDPQEDTRYENYCCLVFNLLQALWEFHHRDPQKIENHFHAVEEIIRHRVWWRSDLCNYSGGYPKEFCKYVEDILLEEDKRHAKQAGHSH